MSGAAALDGDPAADRGAAALAALEAVLRPLDRVLVAYSGGVDSALVLAAGRRALGARCTGVIGVSASLAAGELDQALATARAIGAQVEIVHTDEMERAGYRANGADRCFFCKDTLYEMLGRLARERGAAVVDGTHRDDLGDVRPGRRAAERHAVRSPLVEAGLGKADVRAAARALGLAAWDKPAMACLASRVVHGVEVTVERLAQVEQAEAVLRGMGFAQLRVRSHGTLARIEVFPEELPRLVAPEVRAEVVAALRGLGFREITVDLAGLRDALRI